MKAKGLYSKPEKGILSASPFDGAGPSHNQAKQRKRREVQA